MLLKPRHWWMIAFGLLALMLFTIKSNPEWIGFWGNVVGGIIGAGATIAVLLQQFKQQKVDAYEEFLAHYGVVHSAINRAIILLDSHIPVIDPINEYEAKALEEDTSNAYETLQQAFSEHQNRILTGSPFVYHVTSGMVSDLKVLHAKFHHMKETGDFEWWPLLRGEGNRIIERLQSNLESMARHVDAMDPQKKKERRGKPTSIELKL